jgi:hypothetical protein
MTAYRFWVFTFLILSVLGGAFVYQSRIGEYNDAQATLSQDQQQLDDVRVLVAQERPLTQVYTTLAKRYLKTARSTARTESEFTRVMASVAKKHNVTFVDALFKQPIAATISEGPDTSLPAPTAATTMSNAPSPGPSSSAMSQAIPFNAASLIVTPSDPGDPSIGRPAIDGSLFTRIPVNIRLTGEWKPLIASIQEMSTHNIFMAFTNPVVTAQHGRVDLALDAELLDPAIPVVPGIAINSKPEDNGARLRAVTMRAHKTHAARATVAQR